MGGKAIKHKGIQARRIEREEYDQISLWLTRKLEQCDDISRFHLCRQLHNKQDFGDIDVILGHDRSEIGDLDQLILDHFGASVIHHNKDVVSWDHDDFQIDFIFVGQKDFLMASDYYSYNDLNLFVGSLFHSVGLKFGFDGLNYVYESEHGKSKINISKDMSKIYHFAGLDYSRFEQGFDDVYQVFEFVSTSRFFHATNFLPESLNSINRSRNMKRKNYQLMIDWLHDNFKPQLESGIRPFKPCPGEMADQLDRFFPDAKIGLQLRFHEHKEERMKLLSDMFSGKLIMQWTGIEPGKELGQTISRFKSYVEQEDCCGFDEWMMQRGPVEVKNSFLEWYSGQA